MKRLVVAIFLAAISAGPALAQPYIGVSAGQSDYGDCVGAVSCDSSGTGFKLFGGYMFSPYLGVEASYFDLGKATVDAGFDPVLGNVSGELKANGFAAYGVAAAPIGDFSVFMKAGLASTNLKVSARATLAGSASDSESSVDFAFGVGAAYQFTKNLGVRAEWERFRAKFMGEKGDIDLASIGIVYRF